MNGIFKTVRPTNADRAVFITPNKVNEKIYFGQQTVQLIHTPSTTAETGATNIDNRDGGQADFSYKNGEDFVIYFQDEAFLHVINYADLTTAYRGPVNGKSLGIHASTDGNWIYSYHYDTYV